MQPLLTSSTNTELYPRYLPVPVTFIGYGGIGSTLLPLIVRSGIEKLTLWDFDTVEAKNLQMQNFNAADIGRLKVSVAQDRIKAIDPHVLVTTHALMFTHADVLDGLVISAVDSIQSRRAIFEAVQTQKERVQLLVDGRLTRKGDFLDIYCIDPNSDEEMENYEASLFSESQALKSPRAECMTAHVPYMLSGLIGEALAEWAYDRCHPWKVTYDAGTHHIERYYVTGSTRSAPHEPDRSFSSTR